MWPLCYYSIFIPKNGYRILLNNSSNSGNTWHRVFGKIGSDYCSGRIYSVRKQNTFYYNWKEFMASFFDKIDSLGQNVGSIIFENCTFPKLFFPIDTSNYFFSSYTYKYCNPPPFPGNYLNKVENGIPTFRIDSFTTFYPRSLFFTTITTGYIAASDTINSKIYRIEKTITGGTQWFSVFSDTGVTILKTFFPSDSVGYVIGYPNKFIKTKDGGVNWVYSLIDSANYLRSMYFLNNDTGYACGYGGVLLKTIDGAQTWENQSPNNFESFEDVFFLNDSIGLAYSKSPSFYNTVNHTTAYPIFKTNQFVNHVWSISSTPSQKLNVSPDPISFDSKIMVPDNFLKKGFMTLYIYNDEGKLLIKETIPQNQNIIDLPVFNFSEGVYLIRLENNEGRLSTRFVKL